MAYIEFAIDNGVVKKYDDMNYIWNGESKLLVEGTYNNIPFWIINCRGSHPCCYLEIPKDNEFFGKDYDFIPIDCHGGLTFGDDTLHLVCDDFEERRWFVGWDYAHAGDYIAMDPITEELFGDKEDKKWTINELIDDIKEAIDSFTNYLSHSSENYEIGLGNIYTGDIRALEEVELEGCNYKGSEDLYLDKETRTIYSLESYINERMNKNG